MDLQNRLCGAARLLGHRWALAVLLVYSAAWFIVEGGNIGWDGFATVATLVFTIVIQASQNRDTAALKAQIAELVTATSGARDELADLDDRTEEEIQAMREQGRP